MLRPSTEDDDSGCNRTAITAEQNYVFGVLTISFTWIPAVSLGLILILYGIRYGGFYTMEEFHELSEAQRDRRCHLAPIRLILWPFLVPVLV